jgi:hypothetical protein
MPYGSFFFCGKDLDLINYYRRKLVMCGIENSIAFAATVPPLYVIFEYMLPIDPIHNITLASVMDNELRKSTTCPINNVWGIEK